MPGVHRYVNWRVGSTELAQDLTSETFLRALRGISTFTWQGSEFRAWLFTIARNLLADHYKSARYRLEIPTADMLEADRATDGPENHVVNSVTNAVVLDTVRQLRSDQLECVVLRFFHGLSVNETALAMDRKDDAIKSLQYRALRALAKQLPAGLRP